MVGHGCEVLENDESRGSYASVLVHVSWGCDTIYMHACCRDAGITSRLLPYDDLTSRLLLY